MSKLAALLPLASALHLDGLRAQADTRIRQASRDGRRVFVDESGRERQFHGTNVAVKGPPWHPTLDGFDDLTSLVAEDFELMRSAGLNVIRLNVAWPGVEPTRGVYNETYLEVMRNLSAQAASYGIYTLAEMHQDALSERFCGEGIPAWAAQPAADSAPFPLPLKLPAFEPDPSSPDKFPTRQNCSLLPSWPSAAQSEALQSAALRLYKNHDGLLDSWAAYWGKVASAWGASPELLGFELLNEPDGLDTDLQAGDRDNLLPAYDALAARIREEVPDALIFFAGQPGDRTGDAKKDAVPQGFTHPPGGTEHAQNSVLAFHFYTGQNTWHTKSYLETRLSDAAELGVGTFMTESCCVDLLWQLAPEAEQLGISWAHWEWKDFCRETDDTKAGTSQHAAWGACKTGYGGGPFPSPQLPFNLTVVRLKDLARPYATAVAGNFTTQRFDKHSADYILEYQADPSIPAPTLVSAPNLAYPEGFSVTVEPAESLEVRVVEGGVELHSTAELGHGQQVVLRLVANGKVSEQDDSPRFFKSVDVGFRRELV